jgi:hypothetical protein
MKLATKRSPLHVVERNQELQQQASIESLRSSQMFPSARLHKALEKLKENTWFSRRLLNAKEKLVYEDSEIQDIINTFQENLEGVTTDRATKPKQEVLEKSTKTVETSQAPKGTLLTIGN